MPAPSFDPVQNGRTPAFRGLQDPAYVVGRPFLVFLVRILIDVLVPVEETFGAVSFLRHPDEWRGVSLCEVDVCIHGLAPLSAAPVKRSLVGYRFLHRTMFLGRQAIFRLPLFFRWVRRGFSLRLGTLGAAGAVHLFPANAGSLDRRSSHPP